MSYGNPTDQWVYGTLSLYYGGIDTESLFSAGTYDPELYTIGINSAEIFNAKTYNTNAVDYDTVGEWTGLKDCTGRDVYEDDIYTDGKHTGVVTWNKDRAGFHLLCGKTYIGLRNNKGLIIGNIHDNPEILTE